MIKIENKNNIKLSDLKLLIEKCEESKIPDNTEIHIHQIGNRTSRAKEILADDSSIDIYDF